MIRFFDRAIVGPVGEVKVEELTVATWLQVLVCLLKQPWPTPHC